MIDRWGNIEFWPLLLVIPLMIVIYLFYRKWQKKKWQEFADAHMRQFFFSSISFFKMNIKFVLMLLVVLLSTLALMNPQSGLKKQEVKVKGSDIIICLDVSNSMLAEDIRPNRLSMAKKSIENFLQTLNGDRVGIVIFAGKAFVQLPLTNDYSAARLFLSKINTDLVNVQGTAIAEAIEMAANAFPENSPAGKSIIVISDGENHEADPIPIVEKLHKEKGIRIFTIGVGNPDGAPIPKIVNGKKVGYKKDKNGNTVITHLNEEMLIKIAEKGGGIYVKTGQWDLGLNTILEEINKMQKAELKTVRYALYETRYYYFLFPAIVLLIIEILTTTKRINRKWDDWFKVNKYDY